MLARPMLSRSDAVPSRRLEKIDKSCLTPPLNDRFIFLPFYPIVVPIPESHRNVVSLALIQTKGHRKIVSPSDGYSVVKVLLLKTQNVV